MGQLGSLSDSIQVSNALIMLKYLESTQVLHSKLCALWDHECGDLNALCRIVLSLKKEVGGGDKGCHPVDCRHHEESKTAAVLRSAEV